jgi:dual specificity tyrosine-phosphorylation-regulated kinase 2/3/4
MTDYEKTEILDYQQIYFFGVQVQKVQGKPGKNHNFGYDDEEGDYNVVLGDHLAYRFEVLDFLGKGSFGQALKCKDHKTGELVAVKIIRNKEKFRH